MPVWDLTTQSNWSLLLTEQRRVVYKNNTSPANDKYKYTPIPPIYATPHSHIILIGVRSNSARLHWFLGARVSQFLYISHSNNFNYTSGVQALDIKKVGLNRLTLVEFKNYNITPYVLELDIPYWLEDIYVEVWEYNGTVGATQEFNIEEIQQMLQRIENKINNLSLNPQQSSPPVNFSTGFDNSDSSGSLGII